MNARTIQIDISNEDEYPIPTPAQFKSWLQTVIQFDKACHHKYAPRQQYALSITVMGNDEMQLLNKQYRNKDKPTNILSFPCEIPNVPNGFLGDLVICAPVIQQEALEQAKTETAHWAHMTIHGTLHLLGFDHETAEEAQEMEQLEIDLLNSLDFPNPYGDAHDR